MKRLYKILLSGLFFSTVLFAKGELAIVSAGAGDLDNMTIKAHKAISEADIFFTMDGKAGKYAELIKQRPVYKIGHGLFSKRLRKMMSKEEVQKEEDKLKKIILDGFNKNKKMVIIENGDPTIYGPQVGFLEEFKEFNPKIIPGMSSFNAANAALKRAVIGGVKNANGVTLTIGTDKNKLISSLAESKSTMVFFMDRKFDKFITHLKTLYPVDTPIAIVINAGYDKKEKVVIATLDTIESKVQGKLPFNHLVYVGNFLK
jgi:precorrin-4/cobalt-precorrin-4 C11-methyltransferase